MVVFIATLQVAAGKESDFERLQTELSEISHAREPGLLVYDVIRHAEKEPMLFTPGSRTKQPSKFTRMPTSTTGWCPLSSSAWKGTWIYNFLIGSAD